MYLKRNIAVKKVIEKIKFNVCQAAAALAPS